MKCLYCNGTGKYKKPNDEKLFEQIIDIEMEKGDYVNSDKAQKIAYERVGYTIIDCPFCKTNKQEQ